MYNLQTIFETQLFCIFYFNSKFIEFIGTSFNWVSPVLKVNIVGYRSDSIKHK